MLEATIVPNYRMSKDEYRQFREKTCTALNEMINQKNTDYTAGGGPFANFERSQNVGVDRLKGLMVRFNDKVMRMESYALSGKLAVTNEGIEDVFKDFIGYSLLALGMLEEDRINQQRALDISPDVTVTVYGVAPAATDTVKE